MKNLQDQIKQIDKYIENNSNRIALNNKNIKLYKQLEAKYPNIEFITTKEMLASNVKNSEITHYKFITYYEKNGITLLLNLFKKEDSIKIYTAPKDIIMANVNYKNKTLHLFDYSNSYLKDVNVPKLDKEFLRLQKEFISYTKTKNIDNLITTTFSK